MTKAALTHNGRHWLIVFEDRHHFARDDQGSDTGPFPSVSDARDWIEAIRP